MSKPNTKCRVCGKEYFCCSDSKMINSWRAMACSIDCYKEYMNRIERSRNPITTSNVITKNDEEVIVPKHKNRKKKFDNSELVSENIIED